VLGALFERERTGKGQRVGSSLLAASVHIVGSDILRYLATDQEPRRMGAAGSGGGPHGSFMAGDGKWVQIAVGNDRIYRRLCEAAGHPELIDDPRYRTLADRVKNDQEMADAVDAFFLERPSDEWLELLLEAGVPCGPVNLVSEFVADKEVARQYLWTVERATGNSVPQVNTPISLGDNGDGPRKAPPQLGQHTDEVLGQELGLSADEIADLRAQGVVA
jgi:CoA:oxalate CoA-transferase